jgi:putative tryptophan/tyrosine transport system substrate-binding protein
VSRVESRVGGVATNEEKNQRSYALRLALCSAADAQQPGKTPTIGFMRGGSPTDPEVEAFRQGLRELGYVEGKNIIIKVRNTDGRTDHFSGVAAELVRLKVDIIVAAGGSAVVLAAKPATDTIPIVMTNSGDPVAIGVVASLARPGGNITGLTSLSTDLSVKRLELLKEAVPMLAKVAVLWSPADAGNARNFKETEIAAQSLGLKLLSLGLRTADDLDNMLQFSMKERAGALIIIRSPAYTTTEKRIVEFAAKNRLPTMFPESLFVESGGLMSYAPNIADNFRRAATYVDKILKGAKPADLPVERPMKFELIINLKTAQQIGLTIPPNLLVERIG